ncbi:glucokinase [Candidatus Woesearchaeota archaeon]|nr:glucokinase [Candidatus Woesearchaeota archaeon]
MEEKVYFKKFSSKDYEYFVLAADIGGTNTNIAICGVKNKKPILIFSHHFQTAKLNLLTDAINETLKTAKERFNIEVAKACIAGPGPVSPDHSQLRVFLKADWDINAHNILKQTMLKSIFIINDFDAIGFGINLLEKNDLVVVPHPNNYLPKPFEKGVIGVIGAGTGLGKNILVYDEHLGAYVPHPSEGGHADFPITDCNELEMANYIRASKKINENITSEQLCSGPGTVNIYRFLRSKKQFPETEVTKEIDAANEEEMPGLISKYEHKDKTCKEVMKIFIKNYAKLAKNFCLEIMATGGLYIAGGIAAKHSHLFKEKHFMETFESVYKFSKILRETPVYVITNYNVSLLGSAFAAINLDKWAVKK